MPVQGDIMSKNLYVGNLSYSVDENELENLFAQYGSTKSVRIITDKYTDQSKGFGFVEMEENDAAEAAISALNGMDLKGREIKVNEAREKTERPQRGGYR